MFEGLFNRNEAPKVEEPGAPAEKIKASPVEVDPQTGVVMTKKRSS